MASPRRSCIGNQTFAMRVWLDPDRMASLGVSGGDVSRALEDNNYLAGIGQLRGDNVQMDLTITTDVSDVEDFLNLVVRTEDGALIRLDDIADVRLGAADYDSATLYKGIPAIFIGIEQAPGSNPLDVAARVHALLPDLEAQFPEGLEAHIPYDASEFISESIDEVFKTLAEAVLIVLLVIFLSLGSMRAAIVPSVAVPLSIVGAGFLMLLMGFSINLLTLLAMVLAIGLVVDDAIVVVENVHRHLEMGKDGKTAAIDAARELGLPIIAMTTTLVAVYAPIGFMGGLVGSLFVEFAFTLAGAVLISGIVALTLSPMISARVLRSSKQQSRFEHAVERFFQWLARVYGRALHGWLQVPERHGAGGDRHHRQHLRHVRHDQEGTRPHRRPEHPVLLGDGAADRDHRLRHPLCEADPAGVRADPGVQGELHPGRLRRRHQLHLRRLQDGPAVGAGALAVGHSTAIAGRAGTGAGLRDRDLPAAEPADAGQRHPGGVRHRLRHGGRGAERPRRSVSWARPWAAASSSSCPRTSSTPARARPSMSTATSPAISASACRTSAAAWR